MTLPTIADMEKKKVMQAAKELQTQKDMEGTALEIDSQIIAQIPTPLQQLEASISTVDLIETLQKDIGDPLTKYQKEGVVDALRVSQQIYIVAIVYEIMKIAKQLTLGICVRHGVIYIYTGTYWQETEDEAVKKVLSRMAIKLGFYSPAAAKISDFRDKLFKQFVHEGIEEANAPIRKNILINLKNGTLEISNIDVMLREHRREDFLTYCLDYDYNIDAIAPIFNQFLHRVLPAESTRAVLQEFFGYVFTTDMKLEKGAILLGSGANGKSVVFEIASAIFGEENVSFKGLGDLCMKGDKGNNHRAEIENKLLNYASEISPKGADTEIFKALVSGEPVSGRRLYKNVYTFRNTAKLMFNANRLPTETEHTEGFFRRYLIIPFDVRIPEEERDINLHKTIVDNELSGILNWIIVGLYRLLENGTFSNSEEVQQALETFKRQSNSVFLFIEELGLTPDDDEFTANDVLYSEYRDFCENNGYKKFSQVNLSRELIGAGFESHSKKVNKRAKRGFKVSIPD